MNDRVMDLLEIIREEISLYRDLLEHVRHKTSLLVQGDLEAIQHSNKLEEAFNSKLRELEHEIRCIGSNLCQTFRIPREEFTLLKIADHLEQPSALEIRTQIDLFRKLVQQLKSVNRQNMRLIERTIHYSRSLLGFICNASGSYRQSGLFEQIPSIPPTFSQRA